MRLSGHEDGDGATTIMAAHQDGTAEVGRLDVRSGLDRAPAPLDQAKELDQAPKPDQATLPTCSPACSGNAAICCDKGAGPVCVPEGMTNGCRCDPLTNQPCAGTYAEVCCDKGAGPVCVTGGSTMGCICDPATNKPCTGTYADHCCATGAIYTCRSICL